MSAPVVLSLPERDAYYVQLLKVEKESILIQLVSVYFHLHSAKAQKLPQSSQGALYCIL